MFSIVHCLKNSKYIQMLQNLGLIKILIQDFCGWSLSVYIFVKLLGNTNANGLRNRVK